MILVGTVAHLPSCCVPRHQESSVPQAHIFFRLEWARQLRDYLRSFLGHDSWEEGGKLLFVGYQYVPSQQCRLETWLLPDIQAPHIPGSEAMFRVHCTSHEFMQIALHGCGPAGRRVQIFRHIMCSPFESTALGTIDQFTEITIRAGAAVERDLRTAKG